MAQKIINTSSVLDNIKIDNEILHKNVDDMWASITDINNDVDEIKKLVAQLQKDVEELKKKLL